jgi:cytochrome c
VQKLLGTHACTACHAPDKRVVGPSFREVAAKYAGDAGAAARLAAKMRAGGQGTWGNVPMPPNASLSETDATTLARWILGVK